MTKRRASFVISSDAVRLTSHTPLHSRLEAGTPTDRPHRLVLSSEVGALGGSKRCSASGAFGTNVCGPYVAHRLPSGVETWFNAVVDTWTGAEVRLLRKVALRMTVRDFAVELGITPRTVSKWEQVGSARTPRPHFQAMFDTLLERAEEADRIRFTQALARRGGVAPGGAQTSGRGVVSGLVGDGEGVDRREFNKTLLGIGGALGCTKPRIA